MLFGHRSDVQHASRALPQLLAAGSGVNIPLYRLCAIPVDAAMAQVNATVREGDIIVIDTRAREEEGEVFLLQRGWIRRLYQEGSLLRLEPLDPRQPVDWAAPDQVAMVGRVVVIIRKVTDGGGLL